VIPISETKTILIVDDEPDILDITERFLKAEGYNTLTAPNGKVGLELLEKHYNNIWLILLDIMMPGQSGFAVLKQIKANPEYKNIKVLLFSVKSHELDIKKGLELGADGFIVKPISGKNLVATIKNLE
jgi:DNA-binding response OmpR family regulator